jgi:hypothetical protein
LFPYFLNPSCSSYKKPHFIKKEFNIGLGDIVFPGISQDHPAIQAKKYKVFTFRKAFLQIDPAKRVF